MELGERIVQYRKRNGLSQEQLAQKLDVSRQTISNWELGQTSPDINQSIQLSKVFSISLDELVGNNLDPLILERTTKLEKKYDGLSDLIKMLLIIFSITVVMMILLFVVFSVVNHGGM